MNATDQRENKMFAKGTRVQDVLNDGLILTIESYELLDVPGGEILYKLADPSEHVPSWLLSHSEILNETHYGQPRWTVLS